MTDTKKPTLVKIVGGASAKTSAGVIAELRAFADLVEKTGGVIGIAAAVIYVDNGYGCTFSGPRTGLLGATAVLQGRLLRQELGDE